MSLQGEAEKGAASTTETAAKRFFRNPDLCTLLCKTMITHAALDSTGKMCLADKSTNTLLAFRGVTRQAWEAVMLESPTRSALNLMPRDETTEGILIYLDEPMSSLEAQGRRPEWPDSFHAFITHNETDMAMLHTLETEDPLHRAYASRGIQARIITHHRAAAHEYNEPMLDASLEISAEQLEICSAIPLALEMFLTQPPQKSIRFWISHQYLPGNRDSFNVINKQGIRLGDVVARLKREPGLMRQHVHPRHQLYPYRRWLHDSESIDLVGIAWKHRWAIVRGQPFERNARLNTEMRTNEER